jgi:hypothetical protein
MVTLDLFCDFLTGDITPRLDILHVFGDDILKQFAAKAVKDLFVEQTFGPDEATYEFIPDVRLTKVFFAQSDVLVE